LEAYAATHVTPERIRDIIASGRSRVLGGGQTKPGLAMTVPLHIRNDARGAVTFVLAEGTRAYHAGDIALAEELVLRCAMAADNARLYQDAQQQRVALQAVLDSMTEGVLALDESLRVQRANAFAKRTLAGKGPLEGQRCGEVLQLSDQLTHEPFDIDSAVGKCLQERRPSTADKLWLTFADGKRMPVSVTIAPRIVRENIGVASGTVLLFRDMTTYYEVDELRDNIVSLVSHELRTPLLHIKGFASSLLQPDVQWDEATKIDFISSIDREADRLAKLVSDILEMSRIQGSRIPLNKEAVTPEALFAAGLGPAQPFLARHEVFIHPADGAPLVLADVARMERVLVNLLENAAKYSSEGTLIELGAHARGHEVVFQVRDHGLGIPSDSYEAIFQKFIRLQRPGMPFMPGTGLGLTLCKAIVEAHGGHIWVESEVGEGSTFFFSLPAATRDT
jgi:signal transduction histidine kinase